MSGLPQGWEEATVAEIAENHDRLRVPLNSKERELRKGIYPYYGANGLVDHIDDFKYDGEFVLLAEDGGYFDQPERGVAYCAHGKFWVNNHAHVLRARGGIPQRFLELALNNTSWMPHVGGSTRLKLTAASLARVRLRIPPLAEQRRIVAKLDALVARNRVAKGALDLVPALLERLRQAILAAAFTGRLTTAWRAKNDRSEPIVETIARAKSTVSRPKKMPEASGRTIEGLYALSVNRADMPSPPGWHWVRLLDIARLESGHTPSRSHPEYWGGDVPWIGIRDAREHHGQMIQDTQQHATQAGLDNSAARLLPSGTVCLSRTASVGYTLVMGRPMATSQDFVNWVCSEAVIPEFLMYLLMAEGEHIRSFGEGSTHTTIYFPEVVAFHVCIPPVAEQFEVVRQIKACFTNVGRLELMLEGMRYKADKLERALLAAAFRGELVPQDPNDEPVSVLLEHIRAEREASQPVKNKRGKSTSATTLARAAKGAR